MHPQTLVSESVDASTDSKNIFWVCGCIDRLQNQSLWMHRQTMKLESADASTDSKTRVCGCIHRLYIQSRSMHPPTLYRVGRCIHQPMKYGLSCQLSTDWLHHFGTIYYKTINFLKSCLPIESMMVDHDISFIIQWGICTQVYLMCHNLEGTLLECIYF